MGDKFNKVTIVLEFPTDKWVGYANWKQDVETIEDLVDRFFKGNRGVVEVTKETVEVED